VVVPLLMRGSLRWIAFGCIALALAASGIILATRGSEDLPLNSPDEVPLATACDAVPPTVRRTPAGTDPYSPVKESYEKPPPPISTPRPAPSAEWQEAQHLSTWNGYSVPLPVFGTEVAVVDSDGNRRQSYGFVLGSTRPQVRWLPDGRLVLLCQGRLYALTRPGKVELLFNDVNEVSESPDGEWLLLTGSNIKLWNPVQGTVFTYEADTSVVGKWSPGGIYYYFSPQSVLSMLSTGDWIVAQPAVKTATELDLGFLRPAPTFSSFLLRSTNDPCCAAGQKLHLFDVATAQVKTVAETTTYLGADWSPDGTSNRLWRQLLFPFRHP
jgi:hypothetical protein